MKHFCIAAPAIEAEGLRFATLSTSLCVEVKIADEAADITLTDESDTTQPPFAFRISYPDPTGTLKQKGNAVRVLQRTMSEIIYSIIYSHIVENENTRYPLPLNMDRHISELQGIITGFIKTMGTNQAIKNNSSYSLSTDEMTELFDHLSNILDSEYADNMAKASQ